MATASTRQANALSREYFAFMERRWEALNAPSSSHPNGYLADQPLRRILLANEHRRAIDHATGKARVIFPVAVDFAAALVLFEAFLEAHDIDWAALPD